MIHKQIFSLGSTFLTDNKPRSKKKHLHIVIAIHEDQALVVNITTYKPGCDSSCIIITGEHDFIEHDSFVYYAGARLMDLSKITPAKLELLIKRDMIIPKSPASTDLLKKIQEGAKISDALPLKFRTLL
ncbi:MAG: hypothetical protein HQK99_15735 [Nitrospirae bacterium]|nr:hypothetical protein [Nitrospirota bacterium]